MDQGHSAMQDSPQAATGTFALDLSREGITLYWLSSHAVWNAVEHVVLQDDVPVAEPLARLRARIGGLPEPARVDVWLPEEQIIVRALDTGGGLPTEEMVAALFADVPELLEFDAEVRPGASAYTIAAIPRAVLEQTRDFLTPHGFLIDNYTVRDAPPGMDHAPAFPLDKPIPAGAGDRIAPSRGVLAAAGVGLLVGGGLVAGILTSVFGDPPPQIQTVELDRPAGPAAKGASGAPGSTADAGGRVPEAGDIRSAAAPVTFAEPQNPLAVGRAQIDLPLPVAPPSTEAVGPLPQAGSAPSRGPHAPLAAVAGDMPRSPAIYARPIQTEIAVLVAPEPAALAASPAARQWTMHMSALTANALAPTSGASGAPDLSGLLDVPQPDVLVVDPAQGRPSATAAGHALPQIDAGSYVAMLIAELESPAPVPGAADVSAIRSRPAPVPPPVAVALAAPDPAGDAAAMAPLPQPEVSRSAAAVAPVPAEHSGPLAEFALSGPLARPALTAPDDSSDPPGDDPAPADPVLSRAHGLPAPVQLAALGKPSGPLPPADLSGVRAPAPVHVVRDWVPVQPAPVAISGPPARPAGESGLNAVLLDMLAAAPADIALPLIFGAERQPRARVGTDGTRPAADEPVVVAALTAPPPAGTSALGPAALAVQPLDLEAPRATDSQEELASLLSPANGVQVGRAMEPRQARPETDAAPRIPNAGDRPGTVAAVAAPTEAAAAPDPVELAALGSDLPRARVEPRGTVPPLPDIEFTALDRSIGTTDGRPAGARGPAMAAPSAAPGAVPVPLPALPPAASANDVEVAVINAEPDIVPPLRPEPAVIETRPDVIPPLRAVPEVIEATPDIVPPLRDEAEEGTEVAALTDPDAAPETATDGTDLALPRQIRPRPRPAEIEAAETERMASLAPSELALNRTDAPRPRPSDLARVEPGPAAPSPAAPAASTLEPKRAVPDIPTSASVARAATIKNALPFGRMALIGVFGSSRDRHAIVRLRSGDFIKVQNGDTIEGYRITGMSNNAIRLNRGGRETLLVIPQ